MSEEEKNKESGEVSRRQFLTGAGLVVGGAAIGAGVAWPLAPTEEVEVEKIVEVEKEAGRPIVVGIVVGAVLLLIIVVLLIRRAKN